MPLDIDPSARCTDTSAPLARPAEIEITPAMIEAGVEALALWDRGDSDEWKVWHVYQEMHKARASHSSEVAAGRSERIGTAPPQLCDRK